MGNQKGTQVYLNTGKGVKVSCFAVPHIASITNIHAKRVKKLYGHLCTLWFSDVSTTEETMSIKILIGADHQWKFLDGRLRGPHELVAIKTTLGWALSRLLQGKILDSFEASVNFVSSLPRPEKQINADINKLWDIET